MEVNRKNMQWHREGNIVDRGHTEFIDFLKDHKLTLKKVTTHLEQINDEQLKDMLSCLSRGTHINISLPEGLERALHFRYSSEEAKITLSTAMQGLPETHEAILEWFEAKRKKIIIRRRN